MPTYIVNGTWFSNVNPSGVTREYSRDTTTKSAIVKTAQHAARSRNPDIYMPPTPFSASRVFTQANKGAYADKSGGWGSGVSIDEYYPSGTAPSFSTLNSRAVIQARQALKDQDINLSVAFGERAQTADLVASSARKIAKCLRSLRKGNLSGAAGALGIKGGVKGVVRSVQQSWLELQYGWKPLLSDVHGAATALAKADMGNPERYRITVRGRAKSESQRMFTQPVGTISWLIEEASQQGTFVHLDYRLDNPYLAEMASLGLINPMELAWELVPFSFVADWFVPIGDYLGSFDADLGYIFVGGSKTERWVHRSKTHKGWRTGSIVSSLKYWDFSGAEKITKSVNRTVYGSSPMPRFPGFKNPFSSSHVASALALLGQSVR